MTVRETPTGRGLLAEACDRLGTDHLALTVSGAWMAACPEGSIQRGGEIVVDIDRLIRTPHPQRGG